MFTVASILASLLDTLLIFPDVSIPLIYTLNFPLLILYFDAVLSVFVLVCNSCFSVYIILVSVLKSLISSEIILY